MDLRDDETTCSLKWQYNIGHKTIDIWSVVELVLVTFKEKWGGGVSSHMKKNVCAFLCVHGCSRDKFLSGLIINSV